MVTSALTSNAPRRHTRLLKWPLTCFGQKQPVRTFLPDDHNWLQLAGRWRFQKLMPSLPSIGGCELVQHISRLQ